MPSEINIRNAVHSDMEFVIETIVRAEKGNSGGISYCNLFNINENEFRIVLRKILDEGIRHFEFSLDNFKIAESDGIGVGAYGAWLEGKEGISSGMLKISALRSFLSKEKMAFYKTIASIADQLAIRRQAGTIQFESVYIVPEYRGQRIGHKLVRALVEDLSKQQPDVNLAQVQIIKQNSVSLQAHRNYGFKIKEEKTASDPEILKFYSGSTRVLMEKQVR